MDTVEHLQQLMELAKNPEKANNLYKLQYAMRCAVSGAILKTSEASDMEESLKESAALTGLIEALATYCVFFDCDTKSVVHRLMTAIESLPPPNRLRPRTKKPSGGKKKKA